MKSSYLSLFPVAALAVFCLAPSDCDQPTTSDDASADDAATATGDGGAATQRQLQSAADCKNRGACAAANNTPFSQTQCENDNTVDGERADSVGCGDAFDAFLSCAATITYDCTQTLDLQLQTACGTQYATYVSCN